jgi:hypothetical protein
VGNTQRCPTSRHVPLITRYLPLAEYTVTSTIFPEPTVAEPEPEPEPEPTTRTLTPLTVQSWDAFFFTTPSTTPTPSAGVYTQEMLDAIEYESDHDEDSDEAHTSYTTGRAHDVPNCAISFFHIQDLISSLHTDHDEFSDHAHMLRPTPLRSIGVFDLSTIRERILELMERNNIASEYQRPLDKVDLTSAYNHIPLHVDGDNADEYSDIVSDSASVYSDSSRNTDSFESDQLLDLEISTYSVSAYDSQGLQDSDNDTAARIYHTQPDDSPSSVLY